MAGSLQDRPPGLALCGSDAILYNNEKCYCDLIREGSGLRISRSRQPDRGALPAHRCRQQSGAPSKAEVHQPACKTWCIAAYSIRSQCRAACKPQRCTLPSPQQRSKLCCSQAAPQQPAQSFCACDYRCQTTGRDSSRQELSWQPAVGAVTQGAGLCHISGSGASCHERMRSSRSSHGCSQETTMLCWSC